MSMPQERTANSIKATASLLALTLLGFWLRTLHLGTQELRGDETFGLLFSTQPIAGIISQTLQFLEPHPPLDYILLHGWTLLAGESEWAIRFTSMIFSVLAVPLIYQFGKQVHTPKTGLWAALLFAINPFQIWHAQEARMYAISTALGLAASVALLKAERTGQGRWWVGFAILSVVNAYTHYYALFIIIAQGIYWLALWNDHRKQWRTWVISQIAIIVLYLPWLAVGWRVLTAYHGNGDSPAFLDMLARILSAFSVGQTIDPAVAPFVLALSASIFAIGWIVVYRHHAPSAIYLALYLFVPIFSVYLSSLSRPVFNERYLIAATPPFLTVIAAGLCGGPQLLGRWLRTLVHVLAVLFIAASVYSAYSYFFDSEYARSRGWRELASRLEEIAQPDDIIVQNYPDPTLWYYYRGDATHTVIPAERPFEPAQVIADIEEAGDTHSKVWFVPYKSADWDADGFVTQWLDRHWERVSEEGAGSLALRQYRPIRLTLTEARESGARWDNSVALQAYLLHPSSNGEVRTSPGEAVTVTLFWQVLQAPRADYSVFVHLVAADGRIVAQRDSQPLHGTYPTGAWTAGEVVLDKYVIIVPADAPSGTYTLAVGFYDAQTGIRVPVHADQTGAVRDHLDLKEEILVETGRD